MHETSNPAIVGSNPTGCANYKLDIFYSLMYNSSVKEKQI
jgi:hypothetical protein